MYPPSEDYKEKNKLKNQFELIYQETTFIQNSITTPLRESV